MHPAQAAAIVSALDKVPDTVAVENLEAAERQLVNLARTFTPSQLRDAAQRMRNILDTDGLEPDEKRAYQRESLTLKPADHGVKFGGYLANENAELFRTLIHSGAKPHQTIDGEPDPRPRDKRQADALTTLLTTAAAITHTTTPSTPGTTPSTTGTGTTPSTTGSGATPSTTGSGATTAAGRSSAKTSDADRRPANDAWGDHHSASPVDRPADPGASGHSARDDMPEIDPARPDKSTHNSSTPDGSDHGGSTPDTSTLGGAGQEMFGRYIPGHGPKAHLTVTIDFNALKAATARATGETVFGDDLSAAAVRRLACDAQVIPVVLGSKSQPLDVGTTKRLVTAPMRLALNARDRGCVVCGAPPVQCEAHHLVHWIAGGKTCVSNLVLLCKRHHVDLHSGHWHIEIIDDVVQVTRPNWANPAPVPPGTFQPPIHRDSTTASTDPDRPQTPTTTRHRETTPDLARQAIWGDIDPLTGPGRGPMASPPYDPWSEEADAESSTESISWSTTSSR